MIKSREEEEKIEKAIENPMRFAANQIKGASREIWSCKAANCKNMLKKCKEGCPKMKPECNAISPMPCRMGEFLCSDDSHCNKMCKD